MTQQRPTPRPRPAAKPQQGTSPDDQRDSFDPSGPHGGFGGAGGSQGSVYGDTEAHEQAACEQRLEHEAWQRDPGNDKHGGVIAGERGPYGDYGEIQDHQGGYWYGGGRDGTDKRPPAPAKRKQ